MFTWHYFLEMSKILKAMLTEYEHDKWAEHEASHSIGQNKELSALEAIVLLMLRWVHILGSWRDFLVVVLDYSLLHDTPRQVWDLETKETQDKA